MNIAQRISIDPAAKSYVSSPRKLLIDGAWVNAASGKTFPVYDPSTGEVMVQVAEADAADGSSKPTRLMILETSLSLSSESAAPAPRAARTPGTAGCSGAARGRFLAARCSPRTGPVATS